MILDGVKASMPHSRVRVLWNFEDLRFIFTILGIVLFLVLLFMLHVISIHTNWHFVRLYLMHATILTLLAIHCKQGSQVAVRVGLGNICATEIAASWPRRRNLQLVNVLLQSHKLIYLILCLAVFGLSLEYHGLQLLNLAQKYLCLLFCRRCWIEDSIIADRESPALLLW